MMSFLKDILNKNIWNDQLEKDMESPFSSKKDKDDDSISFNNKLVKQLKKDHKLLFGILTSMVKYVEVDNFEQAQNSLNLFSKRIAKHLEIEQIEMFVFLEYIAKNTTDTDKKLIKNFRNEIANIANAVSCFTNFYTNTPLSEDNKQQFINEARAIITALMSHIEHEEIILYPLYDRQNI